MKLCSHLTSVTLWPLWLWYHVEISIQSKYFLWFSWSNNYTPLLNTKSILLLFLQKIKPRSQPQSQSEYQEHTTQKFYRESVKLKTPTIIYYVYHESWNNLIQNFNPRDLSTIQSSHTVIHKSTNTCANFHVQTTFLLCTISAIQILTMIQIS